MHRRDWGKVGDFSNQTGRVLLIGTHRWKLGQLSPGSTVTFRKISWQDAQVCMKAPLRWIEAVQAVVAGSKPDMGFIDHGALEKRESSGILYRNEWLPGSLRPAVTFRQVSPPHHDRPI